MSIPHNWTDAGVLASSGGDFCVLNGPFFRPTEADKIN